MTFENNLVILTEFRVYKNHKIPNINFLVIIVAVFEQFWTGVIQSVFGIVIKHVYMRL